MIITRSPLRITLGGGGTDLASYYRVHDGFLIAAAIDKYVYITIHQTFVSDMIGKYSKLERVESARTNRHLAHPDHSAGEMESGEEVGCSSVVSGGDVSEVFELVEEALDAIAHL